MPTVIEQDVAIAKPATGTKAIASDNITARKVRYCAMSHTFSYGSHSTAERPIIT